VALLNYGGVRKGLAAGNITVGDVLEVMPFANTLVLVDLTGAELKQALEEDIDFLIAKFGLSANAMPYLGGAIMTVQPTADNGSRITALAIKDSDGSYQPLDPGKVYRTVTNAFIANGGDGFTAIKNAAGFRSDTGVIDSDAFRDYLKIRATVRNPTEQRITILPTAALLPVAALGAADGYGRDLLPQFASMGH
jgi:5'-nucleotidase